MGSDSNIKGMEKLQKNSKIVIDSIHTNMIRHERIILNAVYQKLEWDANMTGLNREQFDKFWTKVPKSYYVRWTKFGKTFDELAGLQEPVDILDYHEFTQMVNEFAQKEAMLGGSNNNLTDIELP